MSALDVLGPIIYPTKYMILTLLAERSYMTPELAAVLGISESGTRQHIAGLERAGLVTHERVLHGPGRPNHSYRLTEVARVVVVEQPEQADL